MKFILRQLMYLLLVSSISISFVEAALTENSNSIYKLKRPVPSAKFEFQSKFIDVMGTKMHYVEQGKGDPVIFIHGNPTSSYLWRNIIPYVSPLGRAIAPDLVGMGKSGKPSIDYTFSDHYRYLSTFIHKLKLRHITFVVHDWGGTLGFKYARLHPGRVKGIVFMEPVLPPGFPIPSFESMEEEMANMFKAFKDPVKGNQLVIEENMFVEKVLPGFVNRQLGSTEMERYRAPYTEKSKRKPLLVWPREVPIAGKPTSTSIELQRIRDYMKETTLPMLLLYASPGVLIPPDAVGWYENNIKNLQATYVGQGLHFIQEDQPDAIGRAIADWLRRLGKDASQK